MTSISFKGFLIVWIAIFVGSSSCVHSKKQSKPSHTDSISAIDFFSTYSIMDKNGEKVNIVDEKETIFYYQGMVMYQMPAYSSVATGISDAENLISSSNAAAPVAYYYAIFNEKSDTIGLLYSSISEPVKDTLSRDGFLSNGFRNYRQTIKDEILLSRRNAGDSLIEKYIPRTKESETYQDTTYLYFKKGYNDIKFTLAPDLDSAKKMKLYKIVALFNGNRHSKDPANRQPRQLRIEFSRKNVQDQDSTILLFKRFEKDYQSYKNNKH